MESPAGEYRDGSEAKRVSPTERNGESVSGGRIRLPGVRDQSWRQMQRMPLAEASSLPCQGEQRDHDWQEDRERDEPPSKLISDPQLRAYKR